MYFSTSFIATALLGFAAAQTGLSASETRSSAASLATGTAPGGMVNTHVVQVGGPNGSLAFYPETLRANIGDLVQFQFNPKNHSVAQSTFDQPCVPIGNIMPNKTDAFWSGFMPTAAAAGNGTNGKLTYTIRVMNSNPIWYYCSQGRHCQGGMVGTINPPLTNSNRTISSFKQLAASASENLSPGQAAGQGNGQPSPSGPSSADPNGGGAAGTGAGATATGGNPAQQTANSAPGRLSQSFFGLGMGGLAAFMLL
ncbi:Cupredoxin [Dendryphion nanum]|uniref:Cupredoxin n=1 Tax=Dendryphion nanum TaxID=256645 RepID=A0A9P9E085_9PLEO|nr:Cupredoxin [Dendryphion nanum]